MNIQSNRTSFVFILVAFSFYLLAQWSVDRSVWWVHEAMPELILVYLTLSVVLHRIVERLLKKLVEFQTQVLLAYLTFSFLCSLVLAVIYISFRMYTTKVFALNFFAVYLLFTSFDIYSLMANLRQISGVTVKYNKNSGEELHENR